ncbi:DMT family transporter [Desulfitobacterium metallireducens]|uniref:Multidrug transporter n=1 Tax=Desulfitobacterium metallireducens DSM 15288 TaxID=871968 RepID=W0E662_9FIRM|nr:DMT family transporter [Desulfitobacterium metallireducens]AHF06360.1 multidrug transporter [Desulfitobacterium metallireducens DSM 15288]
MLDEKNKQRIIGEGAVLLSAVCFAMTSMLIKTAFSLDLSPLQILALQSWIASLLLLLYGLIFNRKIFVVSKRNAVILVFQGLIGSLGTSLFYAYALLYLPVSVATLLLYLYPVLVLGAGVVFLHKKVGLMEKTALACTFVGTTLASGSFSGFEGIPLLGVLLGIIAAITYAFFNVVGEVALQEVSPLTAMAYSQWFSSLGLIFYLKGNILQLPWSNLDIWGIGLALATIASIVPFYLIMFGIQKVGSDRASILSTFELPVTFVMAALILKEIPRLAQWAGGGFVLVGIILLNWRSSHEREQTG